MQKRREAPIKEGLDDYSKEVLQNNRKVRADQEEEIRQMRAKIVSLHKNPSPFMVHLVSCKYCTFWHSRQQYLP